MAHFSINFYVKSLARETRLDLVIPTMNLQQVLANKDDNYYQNLNKKYPLLICLHGFGNNEKSILNNTTILGYLERNGIAACFINGENKWYLNRGPLDDFYNLIERDVLDFLYGNFACLSKDAPLGIFGMSMGGYGALYHYLKNRDKYKCCISLSPATKSDDIENAKDDPLRELFYQTKGEKLNIYLSIGDKDFIIGASKEYNDWFKENNIDCQYKFIPGCDHTWKTWNQELGYVFDYLNEKLK